MFTSRKFNANLSILCKKLPQLKEEKSNLKNELNELLAYLVHAEDVPDVSYINIISRFSSPISQYLCTSFATVLSILVLKNVREAIRQDDWKKIIGTHLVAKGRESRNYFIMFMIYAEGSKFIGKIRDYFADNPRVKKYLQHKSVLIARSVAASASPIKEEADKSNATPLSSVATADCALFAFRNSTLLAGSRVNSEQHLALPHSIGTDDTSSLLYPRNLNIRMKSP